MFDNPGYEGGTFIANITSRGSTDAGPVLVIQGIVPGTTGTYYTILTTTPIGTSSTADAVTHAVTVAPWVSTSANNRASAALPKRLRVALTHASTQDMECSVSAALA